MQTNTMPTLLQAIRQDPDTGLRWAMRDYAALVRGIARRILPGHDRDIEECTADVFVALWRNAARLEATGTPVRAWLTWQVTPGTLASWKASTHTLWLAPISFQVVVTQPTSSAVAWVAARPRRMAATERQ